MLITTGLSGLKNRSLSQKRARSRRGSPLGGLRDWLLEDRCLLSGDPVMVPTTTLIPGTNSPNSIFWNGGPALVGNDWNGSNTPAAPPAKTITIQNNSNQTIYPFLNDPNTGKAAVQGGPTNPSNPGNYYDPFDSVGTIAGSTDQYREYIGYVGTDGNWYLGLPAGATITIQVPLVFWDSGRLNLATDGANLITSSFGGVSNPFRYDPGASLGVSLGDKANAWVTNLVGAKDVASTGLVMFYSSKAHPVDPASDAPSQLTEFAIRDPYLSKWLVNSDQTILAFDYDVSAVDSLAAPTSLEAANVPIGGDGVTQPTPLPNFGWAGSQLIYGLPTNKNDKPAPGTMLYELSQFTQSTNNPPTNNPLLGNYFGGEGWPTYYNPNQNDISIPGGYNIFAQSPLNNGPKSSYYTYGPNNAFMLTSAGTAPVQASAGGTGTGSNQQTQTLPLLFVSQDQFNAFVTAIDGMLSFGETDFTTATQTDQQMGTVAKFNNNGMTGSTVTVNLNPNITLPNGPVTWLFTRPVTDYAATGIMSLWYSWAQYYYDQGQNFTVPQNVTGTIAPESNVLKLTGSFNANQFKVGMTVSGPGINPAQDTTVTVLYVDTTDNQLYLSQLSTSGGTGTSANPYVFGKPLPTPFAKSGVVNINVPNGGSGYQSAPTVKITGGNGIGATAQAVITGGKVTSVVITNRGAGYTAPPTISFIGGNPTSNATATAQIQANVTPLPFFSTLEQQPNEPNLQAFAGSVYEALTTEATVPNITGKISRLPAPMALVGETIGTNAKDLPNSTVNGNLVPTLAGAFTNTIISILRGVPDYTDPTSAKYWYPNPATENVAGPTPFNIYNLDPYVWFIHSPQALDMSVYAFSVDDGVGNVLAVAPGGQNPIASTPNNIQVVFSGTGNLSQLPNYNPNAFFPSLNWGMVQGTGNITSDGKTTFITLDDTNANRIVYNQITNLAPDGFGAYVSDSKGKIMKGVQVKKTDTSNLQLQLSTYVPGLDVTDDTFTFTGTARKSLGTPPPSPPPVSPPPPSSPALSSPQEVLADAVQLAEDEMFLTLDKLLELAERALGIVPAPGLESSIGAYQNAMNANPLDHTLLGQEVIDYVLFETLELLTEAHNQ